MGEQGTLPEAVLAKFLPNKENMSLDNKGIGGY